MIRFMWDKDLPAVMWWVAQQVKRVKVERQLGTTALIQTYSNKYMNYDCVNKEDGTDIDWVELM